MGLIQLSKRIVGQWQSLNFPMLLKFFHHVVAAFLPNERKSGCHGTTLLTSGPIRRPTRQLEAHSPWELDLFGQPQLVLVVVEAFRKVAHQKF